MTNRQKISQLALAVFLAALLPDIAFAHGVSDGTSFWAGFTHPILGWDHVAAMVAVGLWGAFLGAPAIWLLPIVFPIVMAAGALAGILGVTIPMVEAGIAASGIVLGLMLVMKAKPALGFAGALVGFFAIFHGYAHGVELPADSHASPFIIGFVIATGLLHLLGIAFGLVTKWPAGVVAVRGTGVLITGVGVVFLFNLA